MIKCYKCGAEIHENEKFCGKCGTANKSHNDHSGKTVNQHKNITCLGCGVQMTIVNKFCGICGTAREATSVNYQNVSSYRSSQLMPESAAKVLLYPPKRLTGKPAFWVVSSAAFILLLAVIVLLLDVDYNMAPPPRTDESGNDANVSVHNEISESDVDVSAHDEILGSSEIALDISEHDQIYDVQQHDLIMVGFPPHNKVSCTTCNGTQRQTCAYCDGTGFANSNFAEFDVDLFSPFGLGGLADFFNNQPCFYCVDGKMDCMYGVCSGFMGNPEYRNYVLYLKDLYDQTGMRIFQLGDNQVGSYISIYFCTFDCEGTGVVQYLLDFGSFILCDACFAQGHRLEFIDFFTVEELYGNICLAYQFKDYHINRPPPIPAPDRYVSGGMCLSAGCSASRSSTSVYCTSCTAGRGTIDLDAPSTGNCIRCGGRTYTASAHCGACR